LFLFYILNAKDVCAPKDELKLEEELIADVIDDGSSLVSKTMAEEEVKLLNARIKEEEMQCEEAPDLNDTQFNKLDELLTQTKLYSEFLLEKMDDIALVLFPSLLCSFSGITFNACWFEVIIALFLFFEYMLLECG